MAVRAGNSFYPQNLLHAGNGDVRVQGAIRFLHEQGRVLAEHDRGRRAAGVAAGGRTGLTAVTVGVLMLACLIFSPLIQSIPGFATAPALLYVGAQMLRSAREIDWDDMTEAAPAFLTIVFMPFTYSIADGIAFGFISYAVIKLLCNRVKDVPPMVWIVAVLWALKFWYLGG